MANCKAIGERGSWFATVNGERLPCVHKHWIKFTHHCDPGYVEGERQWDELFAAIMEGKKIIVTKDDVESRPDRKSGAGFTRTGYVAVFAVDNVTADESGLRFDLKNRLCDLQG